MKQLYIFLLFFMYGNLILAQQHANWINYSFPKRVSDIDIDDDNVWITTLGGGLVKYNKTNGDKTYYNRASYNLPGNYLLGLICAEDGIVWISSMHYGIGNLSNSICTIYNQLNSGLPFDQQNRKINVDKDNNVWIASFRWMVKYDGINWKTWKTGSDYSSWPIVSDFDITNDGIIWLFSSDGIGKIENDEYTIVSTIGSGSRSKTGCVKVDREGNIWVAIENIGIYKFDGDSFTNYNTSNSCLPTNKIYSIDFDNENNMWLATAEGLVTFNTEYCEVFQPASNDTFLLALRCDDNNITWCGTFDGNLLKFDGSDFLTIGLSNSPLNSNYAYPLFNNNGDVWIGTTENTVKTTISGFEQVYNKQINAGIQDIYGAIWLAFDTGDTCLLKTGGNESMIFDTLNSPFNTDKILISNIKADSYNHIWIATNGHGLYKYNGTSFTNYTTENSGLPSNTVFCLVFDNNNNLWGGTAKGLFKFDEKDWTIWDTSNSTIPTNLVNEIIISQDSNIWFACMDENRIVGGEYGGGLTKFDGHDMITYNMSNSGILANNVFGILDDGDKLWLATYGGGLMSFDKADKWEAYNVTNSGIAENLVQGVIKDKNGNIWMGHIYAGISVFNPDSAIQTAGLIHEGIMNESNSPVIIYPNPVKNELFVKLNSDNEKIVEANIYDLSGKLIQIVPKQKIIRDLSLIHFHLQPDLPYNQILILNLITNKSNIMNEMILFVE